MSLSTCVDLISAGSAGNEEFTRTWQELNVLLIFFYLMQYWWQCEINSSMGELILVAQLAALQITELLLVNSDSFDSVRWTDNSNFGHQSFSLQDWP